jgi:hypothetical protein
MPSLWSPLDPGECEERIRRALRLCATANEGDLVGAIAPSVVRERATSATSATFVAWHNRREADGEQGTGPFDLARTFEVAIARGTLARDRDGTRIDVRFGLAPSAWLLAIFPTAIGVAMLLVALLARDPTYAAFARYGLALPLGGWSLFALGVLLRTGDDREQVLAAIAAATRATREPPSLAHAYRA